MKPLELDCAVCGESYTTWSGASLFCCLCEGSAKDGAYPAVVTGEGLNRQGAKDAKEVNA